MVNELLAKAVPVSISANVWIGDRQIREVLSLEINQQYATHDELRLRCYQDQVQGEGLMYLNEAQSLLGQVAEVKLQQTPGGSQQLEALFVIRKVSFEHHALNEGILVIEGYAPTQLLDAGPHFESFYRQSLTDIAKTVCKPLEQVKAAVQAKPTLTDIQGFVCRFGESSWNFLKRLSNETGQWLYFNGKSLIFGEPEAVQSRDLIYGKTCIKLSLGAAMQPVTAGYTDYDSSSNTLLSQQGNSDTQIAHTDRSKAFKKSKDLYGANSYRYPQALPAREATLRAIGSNRANTAAADMYMVEGESTLHELRVGIITNLVMSRAGDVVHHTPVRVMAVRHVWDVTGAYYNEFKGINAQSPQPPEVSYIPAATAPIVGEVIANNDPLGQGRVQVKFLGWQQEHSLQQTDWIRVLTPDAGSSDAVNLNRGYVFIPEAGDQVMVAFEHNNPDRPYVQGSIFHAANGGGGYQDNHLKTIMTRSGHTISLDDSNNGTHIIIKDPGGNEIYLDTQGKNITITAPETMTLKCKNMNIDVEENMRTNVGQNIHTAAGMNINSTAGINIMSSAIKDLTMLATNIIGKAEDTVTHAATNQITQSGNSFEAMATEADMKIYSNKKVVNTSGEKGNLF